MPRSDAERLIELETRVAFQDRTISELDEQLRWAIEQLQGLERQVNRLRNRMASLTPDDPADGVGYGGELGHSPPPTAEPEGLP